VCRPHNLSHHTFCGLAAAATHHFVGLWRVFGLKSCRQRVLLMVWREDAWTLDGFRESRRGTWISTVDASQTVGLARFSRTKESVRSLSCSFPEHQNTFSLAFDWLRPSRLFQAAEDPSRTRSQSQSQRNCSCRCVVAARCARSMTASAGLRETLPRPLTLGTHLAFGAIASS
jgi:hypothetical protein